MRNYKYTLIIRNMREQFSRYIKILEDYKQYYGNDTILLYQIGCFYYLFSTDSTEIHTIRQIIQLPFSKKPRDVFYKIWFSEEQLDYYSNILHRNDYNVVVFDVNNKLCEHNRRTRECKNCNNNNTHVLKKVMPVDFDYVVITNYNEIDQTCEMIG